jgi:hypothetical protein
MGQTTLLPAQNQQQQKDDDKEVSQPQQEEPPQPPQLRLEIPPPPPPLPVMPSLDLEQTITTPELSYEAKLELWTKRIRYVVYFAHLSNNNKKNEMKTDARSQNNG